MHLQLFVVLCGIALVAGNDFACDLLVVWTLAQRTILAAFPVKKGHGIRHFEHISLKPALAQHTTFRRTTDHTELTINFRAYNRFVLPLDWSCRHCPTF
jgi:hypothetical protein